MRWVIGDIHGMLRPLETLISQIQRADSAAMLYFVGDYVNRGRESRGVIDLLLTLDPAKTRFIRGNHDDVLDQILHGVSYAENASRDDRFMAFQWFLEHGLYETLQSYGVTRPEIARVITQRSRPALQEIIERFPPAHRQFIRSLPVFIEDEDLFVIHGKWPIREKSSPGMILGDSLPPPQLRHEILWGRYDTTELQYMQSWPKRGFVGHTPVPTYPGHENDYSPIVAGKLVLLDTAAALSPNGRLSAMCAETSQLIQTDPTGRLASPA